MFFADLAWILTSYGETDVKISFRVKFHVLRTDRRTRGEEKNSPRKRQQGFSAANNAFIKASCCEVRATWRKDLAIREFEDLKNDKVITTAQFKQRVSQILTSYGYVHPGQKYSYLETLLRGMPKRLVKCKNNKYGLCGK